MHGSHRKGMITYSGPMQSEAAERAFMCTDKVAFFLSVRGLGCYPGGGLRSRTRGDDMTEALR